MNRLWLLGSVLMLMLTACGGGGDSGGGGGEKKLEQEHQMFRCTVYRQVEGFTGISYWGLCANENWNLKAGQPVFANEDDCWAAVDALKSSDPEVYDNSQEDRDRRWAQKLWCFEPDTTPPVVKSISPTRDSSGIPIEGSRVRADFSDNMDRATITTSSFTLEDSAGTLVPGTVAYDYASRTAVFIADETLEFVTTYTARLTTDITDKVGNAMVNELSWSFTTADLYQTVGDETPPRLTVELPSADSTCGLTDNTVTARFSEPVTAAAGAFTLQDSNGDLVDGTVAVNNTVATFTPTLPLNSGDVYTARLSSALTDIMGNALTPTDWSFRTELAPEGSWTQMAAPADLSGRAGHTAVWTGTEMIVWGGYNWEDPTFPWFQHLDGADLYNPETDEWRSSSASGAPQRREQHTATWTGTEMIVWGGTLNQCTDVSCLYSTNTGGRYDPATDTWLPMSTDGAPSGRRRHTAIWTGSELIIWGGVGGNFTNPYGDGARYNPATDTWSPLSTVNAPVARGEHKAVFDGQRMIIWGGKPNGAYTAADGGIYDPVSDVWSALPSQGEPGGSGPHNPPIVVSTGTDMFVQLPKGEWSYDQYADDWYRTYISQTRRFNYQDEQWTAVVDACNPQATPNAVWINGRVLSWSADYSRGESYNETLDTWAPITTYPNTIWKGATVVVANDQVIVWGGQHGDQTNGSDTATNVGYRLSFQP